MRTKWGRQELCKIFFLTPVLPRALHRGPPAGPIPKKESFYLITPGHGKVIADILPHRRRLSEQGTAPGHCNMLTGSAAGRGISSNPALLAAFERIN